jgi:hypothetical protein
MKGLLSATDTFFPIISLSRLLAIESRLVSNSIFGALIIVHVDISLLLVVHSLAIGIYILSRFLIPTKQFIKRDVPYRLLLLHLLVVVVLTVVRLLFILVKLTLDFALIARLYLLELVVLVGQHRLLHRFHKLLDV